MTSVAAAARKGARWGLAVGAFLALCHALLFAVIAHGGAEPNPHGAFAATLLLSSIAGFPTSLLFLRLGPVLGHGDAVALFLILAPPLLNAVLVGLIVGAVVGAVAHRARLR